MGCNPPRVLRWDEMMLSHETPSCELLEVPPRGSHCRRLGSSNAWEPDQDAEASSGTQGGCARLSARLAVLPVPPPCPEQPSLTFLLRGTATPRPEQRQHRPEQRHRRRHHGDLFTPGTAIRELPLAGSDAGGKKPGGSGAAGAVPRTRPARPRRAEEAGGAGSSSRAAPAPARGGRAAGAGLGHGTRRWGCVGAAREQRAGELVGLIPELQRLCTRGPGAPGSGCAEGQTGIEQTPV